MRWFLGEAVVTNVRKVKGKHSSVFLKTKKWLNGPAWYVEVSESEALDQLHEYWICRMEEAPSIKGLGQTSPVEAERHIE